MADITIHGITEEVLERLSQDAEANDLSLEDYALHILTSWHGLVTNHKGMIEAVSRTIANIEKIPKTMTPEVIAELERRRQNFQKHMRTEPGTQGADE